MKQELFKRLAKLCDRYGLYYYFVDGGKPLSAQTLFYNSREMDYIPWLSAVQLSCRIYGPDHIYGPDSLSITTADLVRSEQECHDLVLAFVMEHMV